MGALKPPVGVVPNFDNPPSIAHFSVICAAVSLPVVAIFVSLRMFTKIYCIHKVSAEDCRLVQE